MIGRVADPSFDVKNRVASILESTSASQRPRVQHLYPKSAISTVCTIGTIRAVNVLPIIFKAALAVDCCEISDCHDEVVHKLYRYFFESSVNVGDPLLVHHKISIRVLDIVLVKNDLTELQTGHCGLKLH